MSNAEKSRSNNTIMCACIATRPTSSRFIRLRSNPSCTDGARMVRCATGAWLRSPVTVRSSSLLTARHVVSLRYLATPQRKNVDGRQPFRSKQCCLVEGRSHLQRNHLSSDRKTTHQ
jgi:hypothetical protein